MVVQHEVAIGLHDQFVELAPLVVGCLDILTSLKCFALHEVGAFPVPTLGLTGQLHRLGRGGDHC